MTPRGVVCFFDGRHAGPCAGPLQRAHWIRQQVIRRELGGELGVGCPVCPAGPGMRCEGRSGLERRNPHQPRVDRWLLVLWSPDVWSWMCEAHHRRLDRVRDLRVARGELPEVTERYAARHGLTWWLEREYGPKENAA